MNKTPGFSIIAQQFSNPIYYGFMVPYSLHGHELAASPGY